MYLKTIIYYMTVIVESRYHEIFYESFSENFRINFMKYVSYETNFIKFYTTRPTYKIQ